MDEQTREERTEVTAGLKSAVDDQALFNEAIDGDDEAIEEWYRRYPGRQLPISSRLPMAPTVKQLEEQGQAEEKRKRWVQVTPGVPLSPEDKRLLNGLTTITTIRKQRIVELSAQGFTMVEVGRMLGVSVQHVKTVLRNALKRPLIESTELLRRQTTMRLDKLLSAAWPYALGLAPGQDKPDWEAMQKCLEIERDRRKLLGLDAPEQIDVRMLVHQIAEVRGYSQEDTERAVVFVEGMLQEMRGRLG